MKFRTFYQHLLLVSLLLFGVFSPQSRAINCNLQAAQSLVRWLAFVPDSRAIKATEFNLNFFLEKRNAYSSSAELPEPPPKTDKEATLAYADVLHEREINKGVGPILKRNSIEEVMKGSDDKAKRALLSWADSAIPKKGKFTEKQAAKAVLDLELLLHQSKFSLATPWREGTEAWLRGSYAAALANDGMYAELVKFKKDTRGTWRRRIIETFDNTPGKLAIWGTLDVLGVKEAGDWLLIYFPDHTYFKISKADMATLMVDGLEKTLPAMVEKYKWHYAGNSLNQVLHQVTSRVALVTLAVTVGAAIKDGVVEDVHAVQDYLKSKEEQKERDPENEKIYKEQQEHRRKQREELNSQPQ